MQVAFPVKISELFFPLTVKLNCVHMGRMSHWLRKLSEKILILKGASLFVRGVDKLEGECVHSSSCISHTLLESGSVQVGEESLPTQRVTSR